MSIALKNIPRYLRKPTPGAINGLASALWHAHVEWPRGDDEIKNDPVTVEELEAKELGNLFESEPESVRKHWQHVAMAAFCSVYHWHGAIVVTVPEEATQ